MSIMKIRHIRISLSTLVAGSLLSMLTAFSQGTLRIMPLGNSISYGNMCVNGTIKDCVPISGTEAISYRLRLLNLMNNAGYSVNFIGSQKSGSKYLTDTDNAGFGGINDDRLADIMEKGYSDNYNGGQKYSSGPYLETYPADIILLHIGTNDVLGADTSNVRGVERILNAIDAYEAKSGSPIMVFLARIISYRDHPCNTQPRVIAYNNKIDQLAANRIAGGDNLILVDMECGTTINYSTDMVDEVHPNQVGYNKMGDLWFTELDKYLRSVYVKHTITATASANGSIEPSGQVSVDDGKDQSFTITPASGYEVDKVTVDGSNKGAITTYTFTRVSNDHTISATFKPIPFTIDASAGVNGSINPEESIKVNPGSSQSFTITPDEGYMIKDVLVDGTSAGAVAGYTFSSVSADHSIVASFIIKTYEINTLITGNGSVNPEGPLTVNHGSGQTFSILPEPGNKIQDVLVNGISVG
ncbi:MAG: hypothetical protein IH594_01020, partial [Bacteroidales bacterium]|nr:hypothetical protein [Bacteroidales bacterium]